MRVGRVAIEGGATYLARAVDGRVDLLLRDPVDGWTDPLRIALEMEGPALAELPADQTVGEADVRWLAPMVAPEKIVAVGLNYVDHALESSFEPPAAPLLFPKLASAIVGPGDPIRYAADDSDQVDFEVELAAVIGRTVRRVDPEQALDAVFGYTLANDVSARDAQFSDGQWFRGKNFDTFCPIGPYVVTADEIPDPQQLRLRTTLNGEVLQDESTSEMIFGVAELVSYVSRWVTLVPGDVILTGTPPGVGFARTPPIYLCDGDTVEVSCDTIGTLANTVVVGGPVDETAVPNRDRRELVIEPTPESSR